MPQIWKETLVPKRKGDLPPHAADKMWAFPLPPTLPTTLLPREVWYVRVCSFTFVFHTLQQLQACLDYYGKKTHPSSRIPFAELANYGGDSSECQRWFERLPMYLLEEPKRQKVVAALRTARSQWSGDLPHGESPGVELRQHISQFHEVALKPHLKRLVAVNRNGNSDCSARLGVDVMTAVDAL